MEHKLKFNVEDFLVLPIIEYLIYNFLFQV